MLGLLYKDLHTAKRELMMTGFLALCFVLFSVITGQKELLGPTIGVLISVGSLVPTYSIHYDKASGWNKFICASPITRTQVILSKYLAGFASLLLINGLIVLENILMGSPMPAWAYPLLLSIMLLLQAVMLPVCLKFGQNFGVAVFLVLVFFPVALLFLLNRLGVLTDAAIEGTFALIQQNASLFGILGVLAVLVLYGVSFLITRRIYIRMEI